jgi:hypothetical protein
MLPCPFYHWTRSHFLLTLLLLPLLRRARGRVTLASNEGQVRLQFSYSQDQSPRIIPHRLQVFLSEWTDRISPTCMRLWRFIWRQLTGEIFPGPASSHRQDQHLLRSAPLCEFGWLWDHHKDTWALCVVPGLKGGLWKMLWWKISGFWKQTVALWPFNLRFIAFCSLVQAHILLIKSQVLLVESDSFWLYTSPITLILSTP